MKSFSIGWGMDMEIHRKEDILDIDYILLSNLKKSYRGNRARQIMRTYDEETGRVTIKTLEGIREFTVKAIFYGNESLMMSPEEYVKSGKPEQIRKKLIYKTVETTTK